MAMIRNDPVPGPDQPVVEADHHADQAGHRIVLPPGVAQLGQLPGVGLEDREQPHGDQRGHDDRLEDARRQQAASTAPPKLPASATTAMGMAVRKSGRTRL